MARPKGTSRYIRPALFGLLLLLSWEYVISNDANITAVNKGVERAIGWNPGLSAVSPIVLPRPSIILNQLLVTPGNGRGGPAYYWTHTSVTLASAGLGFVVGNLIAIATATLFLYVTLLERGMMPIALIGRSIPLVAITPLLLRLRFGIADLEVVERNAVLRSLFGTDFFMRMIIVVVIVYFPTLVNAARGFRSVEPSALELFHTVRASRWQIYWKLRVPSALPLIFAAFRVAASSAILAAVIAEWLSSHKGLGYVIFRARAERSDARMWMAMVLACIIAIVGFYLVDLAQKRFVPWFRSTVDIRSAVGEG